MDKEPAALRTVEYAGERIVYRLERKAVKNLNLRVRRDGSVYVSAGARVPPAEIDAFVMRSGALIQRAQARFAALERSRPAPRQYVSGETFHILGRPLTLRVVQAGTASAALSGAFLELRVADPADFARKQRLVTAFLRQQSAAVFGEVLRAVYPPFQRYGVAMPELRIREMETRWGSCLVRKGIVTLNQKLLAAPRRCIEYVAVHELCHFLQPNHSRQFYDLLTRMLPDWRARKAELDGCVTD